MKLFSVMLLGGALGIGYALSRASEKNVPSKPGGTVSSDLEEIIARHVEGSEQAGRRSLVLDATGLWSDGILTTPDKWLGEPGDYDLWVRESAKTTDYNELWRKLRSVDAQVIELDERKPV